MYAWRRIDSDLRRRLLPGKEFINLHARQFQFAGELHATGRLNKLRARITQQPLPSSLLQAICSELDTQSKLPRLLKTLENCISFLASVSGNSTRGIDAGMPLKVYVVDQMLMPAEDWRGQTTESIDRQVCVGNLLSLFLALEQRMQGSPLDNVPERYRGKLPPDVVAQVIKAMHLIDATFLHTLCRDLLVNQLVEGSFPADAPLKEYASAGTCLYPEMWTRGGNSVTVCGVHHTTPLTRFRPARQPIPRQKKTARRHIC